MDILAKRLMKIAKMVSAGKVNVIRDDDDNFNRAKRAVYGFLTYVKNAGGFLWDILGRFGYEGKVDSLIGKIQGKYNEDDFHCSGIFRELAGVLEDVADRVDDEFSDEKEWEKAYDAVNGLMGEAFEAKDECEAYEETHYYRVEIGFGGMGSSEFFEVEADDAETALEFAVALCEKNELTGLLESPEGFDELDEDAKEDYIYVDGSSFGASHPWYVRSDLVDIREI